MKRIWSIPPSTGAWGQQLSEGLGVPPAVADILVHRGIRQIDDAVDFLRPTVFNLLSPFLFVEMPKAVERLSKALKKEEKVLIYGDYDVDGVTSTALLYMVLVDLGFRAVAYIPSRHDEGYGLHSEAIEKAKDAGVSVIITVDCGITASAEVEFARSLGIDVIITDHHEPPTTLPPAWAIINPKLESSGYPFRELAGVGVAFKLAQALLQELGNAQTGMQSERKFLDLVALGTIADVVPLTGENRVIVYYGLKQMEETSHPGLQALLEECGLWGKQLKAGQIAFMVAPRINAAGRMDTAKVGLELLLTGNSERAKELARQLSHENSLRQETEQEILAQAIAQIESAPLPRVVVLSAGGWHHGVIGIVASRLVEKYYRPVFMISENGEEAKGSARGIPGYHVLEQLTVHAGLLSKFGGHRQAAGFSLPTENISLLREGLNAEASLLDPGIFTEELPIDSLVSFAMISEDTLRGLEQLAPFGSGNPSPLLATKGVSLKEAVPVGKGGNHLKLRLGPDGRREGLAFRQGERLPELAGQNQVDIAFSLDWNYYLGQEQLQLGIKDFQAKADWSERIPKGMREIVVQAETAATMENEVAGCGTGIVWADWRELSRREWMEKVDSPAGALVCDVTTGKPVFLPLSGFQDSPTTRSKLKGTTMEELSTIAWNFGIIAGVPLFEEDLSLILETFAWLGIQKLAAAEAELPNREACRKSCGYSTREDLVMLYRRLQEAVKSGTPFYWVSRENEWDALRIFEELGLVNCLGGTEKYALELPSATKKLDLESSLRYRVAKKRWEGSLAWQEKFRNMSLPNGWKVGF